MKKWMTVLLMAMLIFTPPTVEARGFGGHSFSRSSYSSHFSSPFSSHSSGLFGSRKGSSSSLFGPRSSTSGPYRTYARPTSGFHFGSFGLGMLVGGLFHPFGGYYGMGGYYGYHPFGFLHFIFDLFILWIVFRIIRSFFRR